MILPAGEGTQAGRKGPPQSGLETYLFRDGPVLMKARELYQHFSFVNITVTPVGPCPLDAADIVTFSYSVEKIEFTPD